jgi:hypothetical protein
MLVTVIVKKNRQDKLNFYSNIEFNFDAGLYEHGVLQASTFFQVLDATCAEDSFFLSRFLKNAKITTSEGVMNLAPTIITICHIHINHF